jgi:hypothetical protein
MPNSGAKRLNGVQGGSDLTHQNNVVLLIPYKYNRKYCQLILDLW